jgi:hypothetical protein
MLNVISLIDDRVVEVKQVNSNYVLQDEEFIVDEGVPEYLGKVYNAETKTFSEYVFTKEEVEQVEIQWRNSELVRTDSLMPLSDYPYKEKLTAYRQALRDWPSTPDFPDTRPTLGI